MHKSRSKSALRILFLLIGLLISFAVLEAGTRILSSYFSRALYRSVAAQEKTKSGYAIMTIGESTTTLAGSEDGKSLVTTTSYPSQLEKILNAHEGSRKFTVVNKGMMNGNSDKVVSMLEADINEYKPDMIIAMMGIVDDASQAANRKYGNFLDSLWYWAYGRSAFLRFLCIAYERMLYERDKVTLPRKVLVYRDFPPEFRDEAYKFLSRVHERRLSPDRNDLLPYMEDFQLARFFWVTGQFQAAEETFKKILRERDVGYVALAEFYVETNRVRQAETVLNEAIGRHPEDGVYRQALVSFYLEQGERRKAEGALKAAKQYPKLDRTEYWSRSFLLLAEAAVRRAAGDYAAAMEKLREASELGNIAPYSPFFPQLRFLVQLRMGEALFEAKDYTQAETHLLNAIEIEPKIFTPHYTLAKLYKLTGREQAAAEIQKNFLKSAGRAVNYYELIKYYSLTGKKDEAKALSREMLERFPSLRINNAKVRELAKKYRIPLVLMQYPGFGLWLLKDIAENDPYPIYVDTENIFSDDVPNAYFFEPKYPYVLSHYTSRGAKRLAAHVADSILSYFGRK